MTYSFTNMYLKSKHTFYHTFIINQSRRPVQKFYQILLSFPFILLLQVRLDLFLSEYALKRIFTIKVQIVRPRRDIKKHLLCRNECAKIKKISLDK